MNLEKITGRIDDKHIDVIPGIRVLAIALIAWFHIWQQSWLCPTFVLGHNFVDLTYIPAAGYLWVDMFIMLSAFQLALPYIHRIMNHEEFESPLDFYKRRFIRIMPSYYFSVIVCFVIALVLGEFYDFRTMFVDLFTHLTFTQTFIDYTYLWTNLNVVLWTVAVLMQFYLLFPFIIRVLRDWPVLIFSLMVSIGVIYRMNFVNSSAAPAMSVNQLLSFFDVLAIGILGAYLVVAINKYTDYKKHSIGFTILSIGSFAAILGMMKDLRSVTGHEAIQRWQGSNRLALAALFLVFLVSTIYAIKNYRFIFSNKIMIYLASISYNYYIWHQYIAVRLKQMNIPPAISEMPNMVAEQPWQTWYTIFSFIVPLVVAIVLTFLIDKLFVGFIKKRTKKTS
ncbi:MAG: acyltransferase [Eubacteriales bacterium]